LAGFSEAECCFSIRKNGYHSFSIRQKNDKYLIEAIKVFFHIDNKVRNPSKDFYCIEVFKKTKLMNIINHFDKYSFLGQKLSQFLLFKNFIYIV
jgi:autonomous glycyl radical cofactor GrcA